MWLDGLRPLRRHVCGERTLDFVTAVYVRSCNACDSYRKTLTLRRLMSYIYGAPILDVSRSHTTTQHSR